MNEHYQKIGVLFDSSNWSDELSDSSTLTDCDSLEQIANFLWLAVLDRQRNLPWANVAPETAEIVVDFVDLVMLISEDQFNLSYDFEGKLVTKKNIVPSCHQWRFQSSPFYAVDHWEDDKRVISVSVNFAFPASERIHPELPADPSQLIICLDLNAEAGETEFLQLLSKILDGVVQELSEECLLVPV